jgi:hypothetical protein
MAGQQAMTTHAYNAADDPYEFLRAAMHDRALPLHIRMDAAFKLLWLRSRQRPTEPEPKPPLCLPEPKLSEKDKQWQERLRRYGLDPRDYGGGVKDHGWSRTMAGQGPWLSPSV